MQTVGSESFALSKQDLWKIVKGALIAAAGAFLTFLATIKWDLGPYTLLLAPLISTAINAALKWLQNTEQTVDAVKLLVLLAAMLTLGDAGTARAIEPADVTVTVVTMRGCRPCAKLKEAFENSADLRSYKPTFVDLTQFRELRTLRITSFPTLLVRTSDKAIVYRKSGFDGDAKRLAGEMSAAIKRYVPPAQRRRGVRG